MQAIAIVKIGGQQFQAPYNRTLGNPTQPSLAYPHNVKQHVIIPSDARLHEIGANYVVDRENRLKNNTSYTRLTARN